MELQPHLSYRSNFESNEILVFALIRSNAIFANSDKTFGTWNVATFYSALDINGKRVCVT